MTTRMTPMAKPTYPLICRHATLDIFVDETALVVWLSDNSIVYCKKDGSIRVPSMCHKIAIDHTILATKTQAWVSLSFVDAVKYLEDHNVPTKNFEEMDCFAKEGGKWQKKLFIIRHIGHQGFICLMYLVM